MTIYRGILISVGWFHCIQRYTHFSGWFHCINLSIILFTIVIDEDDDSDITVTLAAVLPTTGLFLIAIVTVLAIASVYMFRRIHRKHGLSGEQGGGLSGEQGGGLSGEQEGGLSGEQEGPQESLQEYPPIHASEDNQPELGDANLSPSGLDNTPSQQ